jgi:two-component system chemotaxis response regulator CheY
MKTILLVDDSTSIRQILKSALTVEYQVLEAENGQAGLEAALKSGVDLFLLDVNMPVMDGITLLGRLKTLPQFAKTPVIMLTTETKEERKAEAKSLGATGWILKPCEPDQLLAAVRRILN